MNCEILSTVAPLSGSFASLIHLPERVLAIGRSLSSHFSQISNSYQVVGSGSELEDPTYQSHSSMSGLAQQPHSLQPTEDFFHSFALTLTNFITRVTSGPLINRAASSLVVLRHVRRHLAGAQISDKVFRVVSFVRTHGDPFLLCSLSQHRQSRFSFGSATGTSQRRIHHQAVAVLHQHVSLISQFRFAAPGLLKQPEILVSSRSMRFVRAFLAMKVHCGIAGIIRLVVAIALRGMFRLETFQTQPSTSVPSTVKCSSDNNSLSRAKSSTAAKNSSAISPRSKRSRFLLKVVASQTASSMLSPTNQRNACCTAIAPSASVRCVPSKALAATAPAATAPARSTVAPPANTTCQSVATVA